MRPVLRSRSRSPHRERSSAIHSRGSRAASSRSPQRWCSRSPGPTARSAGFDFIQFDDTVYVLENPIVHGRAVARQATAIALTSFHTGNWIPLAWLSHMLDVEMFGLDPGRHHLR